MLMTAGIHKMSTGQRTSPDNDADLQGQEPQPMKTLRRDDNQGRQVAHNIFRKREITPENSSVCMCSESAGARPLGHGRIAVSHLGCRCPWWPGRHDVHISAWQLDQIRSFLLSKDLHSAADALEVLQSGLHNHRHLHLNIRRPVNQMKGASPLAVS